MINPWKVYNSKQIGTVISIDQSYGYWFKISLGGQTVEGYLRDNEPNYKRLKIGDKVRCGANWSITGDHWLIRTIRKLRNVERNVS